MEIDTMKIEKAFETAIIKMIQNGEALKLPFDKRIDISNELHSALSAIDYDRVRSNITELLETELAQKIVNKIVTEMGNDIKKLMENATIRDDFRFLLRKGVETILERVRK
jgi:hypothetical protein